MAKQTIAIGSSANDGTGTTFDTTSIKFDTTTVTFDQT